MDICKICGAARDPMNTNCKFCGTAYQLSNVTGETYINALNAILTRIDEQTSATSALFSTVMGTGKSVAAKVSAISTFAMPSDLEGLLQFFAFCHGNAQIIVAAQDHSGFAIKGAWYGKAKMAFTQLKMKSIGNPSLAPLIAEYEPLYGVNAKKPLSPQAKVLMVMFPMLAVLVILVAVAASNERKEEDQENLRLQSLSEKVQSAIERKDWDSAETLANQIHWTIKQYHKEGAPYNQMREGYLKQIQAAKNGGR